MAYTEPTQRATNYLVSASVYNTDLVDNISNLNSRTAVLEGVGVHKVVLKTADETVNNSAALQADDELIIPVTANYTYGFKVFLVVGSSDAAADIKFGWTVPAGTTMLWHNITSIVSADQTDDISVDLGAGIYVIELSGKITVDSTAGNVTLTWAQNTATAADTVIGIGSHIVYYRLA